MKKSSLVFAVCFVPSLLFAWGGTGHKMINRNAVMHLPASMGKLIAQQAYLESHASDPDFVQPKVDTYHFIDIDKYPNFQNKILRYDSLVAVFGLATVADIGTLPWVTVAAVDSLSAQFKRGDWTTAYLTAAYLGHWVGDGHQPLHLTKNYNVSGMHSRYESTMIDKNISAFNIVQDTARYIGDPLAYVFHYVDAINPYADSINAASARAKAATGSESSAEYYASIWSQTGTYTKQLIQQATVDLASFWYTAWVNAGLLYGPTGVAERGAAVPGTFALMPNYPNPFNPSTNLRFTIGSTQFVSLGIYDMLGRSVASLVHSELAAGTYTIQWNASGAPSGVYYCRMTAGTHSAVQRMVLQR